MAEFSQSRKNVANVSFCVKLGIDAFVLFKNTDKRPHFIEIFLISFPRCYNINSI